LFYLYSLTFHTRHLRGCITYNSQDGFTCLSYSLTKFSISLAKAETLLRQSTQYVINSNLFHIQCVQTSLPSRDGGGKLNVCPTPTVSNVTFISQIVEHAVAKQLLQGKTICYSPTSLLTTISTRQKQTYHCITIFICNCA